MNEQTQPLEIGVSIRPAAPDVDIALIQEAERLGFDSATFGDSQNSFASPFVRMGAATQVTERIKFASCGVPAVTRHPAMVAGEALTVHKYSGGRAILGLARGDSALSQIGRAIPGPLPEFESFARDTRALLRGETIESNGRPSKMNWLPADLPPVPVDIACTGPNAIAMAARVADRISFAVGAQPSRIAWALDIARASAVAAGRDLADITFGAFLNTAVSDDVELAAETMRGPISYSMHFSAMPETKTDEQPEPLRRTTEPLRRAFMIKDQTPRDCVDAEAALWWGAIGTAAQVTEQIAALADLGLTHVYLLNGSTAPTAGEFTQNSLEALSSDVMPELRSRTSLSV
jgi:5,10-methylenetetrahydromethanopterin reductase